MYQIKLSNLKKEILQHHNETELYAKQLQESRKDLTRILTNMKNNPAYTSHHKIIKNNNNKNSSSSSETPMPHSHSHNNAHQKSSENGGSGGNESYLIFHNDDEELSYLQRELKAVGDARDEVCTSP